MPAQHMEPTLKQLVQCVSVVWLVQFIVKVKYPGILTCPNPDVQTGLNRHSPLPQPNHLCCKRLCVFDKCQLLFPWLHTSQPSPTLLLHKTPSHSSPPPPPSCPCQYFRRGIAQGQGEKGCRSGWHQLQALEELYRPIVWHPGIHVQHEQGKFHSCGVVLVLKTTHPMDLNSWWRPLRGWYSNISALWCLNWICCSWPTTLALG